MKNHSLMEEIQKGQVVLVKNKGDAKWLSGCIYLGEIQDGCSKTH